MNTKQLYVRCLVASFLTLGACTVSPNSGQPLPIRSSSSNPTPETSPPVTKDKPRVTVPAAGDGETCLDLSGNYKIPAALIGASSACSKSGASTGTYYQVTQNGCTDIRWMKVHKIAGTHDCIEEVKDLIIDESEHALDDKTIYTYVAADNEHRISYKNLKTGQISMEVDTLDNQNNLKIKDAAGQSWSFQRESK